MLVFPQLSTGAAALYPLTKQGLQRTVVNTLADGSTVVYADPVERSRDGRCVATGLTLAEWNAIESLFEQTAGMAADVYVSRSGGESSDPRAKTSVPARGLLARWCN